jgi:hypothetical protein
MNRLVFGLKNVKDKAIKISRDPAILKFYLNAFIFSKFRDAKPDIFIVSYPKCGRTWVRIMLKKSLELLGQEEVFDNETFLHKLPSGRVVKFTHDQGDWVPAPKRVDKLAFDLQRYKGKKVCFIVREPADVLVSSWYHLKYRERIYAGALSDFIRDDALGIKKIIAFMNMWVENFHASGDSLLVTYEDLRKDASGGFKRIFDFIGLDIGPVALSSAIEETSFSKMKDMERKGALSEPWMKMGADKSEGSMKIRKGKVDGYKDELSDEDIRYIDDIIKKTISPKLPYGQKRR